MIDKLTPEQEADLEVWRDKWTAIGLSCEALVWGKVESAVEKIYRCGGLEPPKKIIRVTSPMVGVLTLAVLKSLPKGVFDKEKLAASVEDSVWASVRASVGNPTWPSFYGFHESGCCLSIHFFTKME